MERHASIASPVEVVGRQSVSSPNSEIRLGMMQSVACAHHKLMKKEPSMIKVRNEEAKTEISASQIRLKACMTLQISNLKLYFVVAAFMAVCNVTVTFSAFVNSAACNIRCHAYSVERHASIASPVEVVGRQSVSSPPSLNLVGARTSFDKGIG